MDLSGTAILLFLSNWRFLKKISSPAQSGRMKCAVWARWPVLPKGEVSHIMVLICRAQPVRDWHKRVQQQQIGCKLPRKLCWYLGVHKACCVEIRQTEDTQLGLERYNVIIHVNHFLYLSLTRKIINRTWLDILLVQDSGLLVSTPSWYPVTFTSDYITL